MEETPQITYEVSAYDLASATFVREVMTRALPYVQSFRWPTDENSLGPLAGLSSFVIQKSSSSEDGVFEFQGCVIFIHLGDGFVNGYVGGGKEVISSVIETLRVRLPEVERARDFEISVTFWYAARHGASASRRRIAVDPWRLVEDNYPRPTRQMLDSLMTGFRPGPSGRLILWHGEPGTGKSNALRTLGWEWREWCRFEYVVDSERFLGDGDYLMRVLLESPRDLLDEEDDSDHDWRLVVLEDAGELMVADARDRVGQGLSRLLNTVDGLLGEGLRLLILITTNEPLGRLHPAVARPGRCAAEIEFRRFGVAEGSQWLAARGGGVIEGDASLAELFSRLDGGEIRSRPVAVSDGLYL